MHRPLSEWIADATLHARGGISWERWSVPNGGDRDADARHLPRFATGWRRERLHIDGTSPEEGVLGLVHPATGEAVVELDDTAIPLQITKAGIAVIADIERSWPEARLTAAQREILGGETPGIRHALLDRLAAEGEPPADLFHLLPWEAVKHLADEISASLDSGGAGSAIRLHHWFVPTGCLFSSALEQIAAGLESSDRALIRQGATALCQELSIAELPRFPRPVRATLAEVLRRLSRFDPLLRYSARPIVQGLEGPGDLMSEQPSVRLPSALPAAADEDMSSRQRVTRLDLDPLRVTITVRPQRALEITAEATVDHDAARKLYGQVILRTAITSETGTRGYLIPLGPSRRGIGGSVDLSAPEGIFNIEVNGPPIGLAEAWALDVQEVLRSIEAADRPGRRLWREIAARFAPGHPIRRGWDASGSGA